MATATVAAAMPEVPAVRSRPLDTESREWLASLRSSGAQQAAAIERLHDLLLRAARFEVARRRPGFRTSAATSSTTSRRRRPTTR